MHKDPIKMRPVISQVASMLQAYSMWVDRQLQQVLHLCHSRLPDSQTLVEHLRNMGPLPETAIIVKCDACSMYTCIDPDHALHVLQLFF